MKKTRASSIGAAVAALLLAVTLVAPADATRERPTPGADGAGDPYFPLDGNGGYDVGHYDLALRYEPDTDLLRGRARIQARATQSLSSFNLDLVGLSVRHIRVDGDRARWSRAGQELTVTPRRALRDGRRFTVTVVYDGVPQMLEGAGFIATDDGFVIAGQPHVAASWFPVNDHPIDKASYTFRVQVPRGLEVVANGDLVDRRSRGAWSTWTWHARDPMASYLTTVNVGEFDLHAYRADGVRYLDAIDPDLYDPIAAPTTGTGFAVSQAANSSYKRLMRTISVPAEGASVGFTLTRATEADWDYALVEVHTVGEDDWTTLPDANGHTTQATGNSCLLWPDLHPFIAEHYQVIDQEAGTCEPTGASGEWWAASGASDGPEEWLVDLTPYAGSDVELSISYVSDDVVALPGLFVDDVVVSTGEGSTSFEGDLGGWAVPGAPAGSPGNENDWIAGTAADVPPPPGEVADGSFARQPEIIDFLSGYFGRYPWRSAGGIVDDVEGLGFALETQTRPIYSREFFSDPVSGDAVVVHELAHQWYGDSLTIARWREIWLNEGFATYAEWLWSEREGLGTAQETFDFFYHDYAPAEDPWWDLVIGDPGPEQLFAEQVYFRGAMTLHALRTTLGDADFFRLLRVWAQSRAGENVTTAQFIRLAERISGRQLDDLFDAWLYTPGRPAGAPTTGEPQAPGPELRRATPPASAQVTLELARRAAAGR